MTTETTNEARNRPWADVDPVAGAGSAPDTVPATGGPAASGDDRDARVLALMLIALMAGLSTIVAIAVVVLRQRRDEADRGS